ncbi:MAG: sel1 repeat family protein [Gammaproteobacteria bacterium]|nr:sel1 repeat family protein [Gammaproteobacteria bacterium]
MKLKSVATFNLLIALGVVSAMTVSTDALALSSKLGVSTGSKAIQLQETVDEDMLKTLAEGGEPMAQYLMGRRYRDGEDGHARNYELALEWYIKAANNGFAPAQIDLGQLFADGEGVEKNMSKAVKWFKKAAEQGYATAQFNMGNMYRQGEGVKQDLEKSAYWYEKAANNGFAHAQFNLALMYYYGKGVKKDDKKVLYWYERAANQGVTRAQYLLGAMHEAGVATPRNVVEALHWYSKASDAGDADAYRAMNELVTVLSEEERDQAKSRGLLAVDLATQ